MSGVRVSFLARSMADLAVRSPEAKAVFVKLRDETEDRLINGKTDGDTRKKSWDDLRDWLVLNERVLKDREPVLAWVDRIKDRPTATQTFARTRDIIDDVLIDNGRWALYGRLIDDHPRLMRQMVSQLAQERRFTEALMFRGDGQPIARAGFDFSLNSAAIGLSKMTFARLVQR